MELRANLVRVLKVPNPENEEPGDNWPLAQFGYGETVEDGKLVGHHYHVVTNRVRASEVGFYEQIDPAKMAKLCVDAVNGDLQTENFIDGLGVAIELIKRRREGLQSRQRFIAAGELSAIEGILQEEIDRSRE